MKSKLAPYAWTKLPPRSPKKVRRWIEPYQGGAIVTTNAAPGVAGRVYLEEFEVENEIEVDAIAVANGDSVAGNITVGIYGPIPTEETCLGAPVVVQSASTALSGTNGPQVVTFSPTKLQAGRYYAALEFDDTTTRYFRYTNQPLVTGWTQIYDRSGGYGALTDPCPTPTNTSSVFPNAKIRSTGS